MTLRRVALPPDIPGQLWLSHMPGRLEPWPSYVAQAQHIPLHLAVCLTPMYEVQELSPGYHAAITGGRLPFRWMHVEMLNFGLATGEHAFRNSVDEIVASLRRGENVMIHCAAGIGRTGTTAACVLKRLGLSREQALDTIRAAGANPQSAEQSGWIDRF